MFSFRFGGCVIPNIPKAFPWLNFLPREFTPLYGLYLFCPKYRRKVLVNGVDVRLKELIRSIADENKFEVIEMEIMPDHVHLLLEVDPQFGIHKAVKTIRGKTSRILRQEFHWLTTKLPTLWTNSYFCSTVGGAPLEIVKQYIESQKTSQRK